MVSKAIKKIQIKFQQSTQKWKLKLIFECRFAKQYCMSSPNKNMNLYISCLADVGGMFLDMKLHVEWRYKQTKTLQNSIWKH